MSWAKMTNERTKDMRVQLEWNHMLETSFFVVQAKNPKGEVRYICENSDGFSYGRTPSCHLFGANVFKSNEWSDMDDMIYFLKDSMQGKDKDSERFRCLHGLVDFKVVEVKMSAMLDTYPE